VSLKFYLKLYLVYLRTRGQSHTQSVVRLTEWTSRLFSEVPRSLRTSPHVLLVAGAQGHSVPGREAGEGGAAQLGLFGWQLGLTVYSFSRDVREWKEVLGVNGAGSAVPGKPPPGIPSLLLLHMTRTAFGLALCPHPDTHTGRTSCLPVVPVNTVLVFILLRPRTVADFLISRLKIVKLHSDVRALDR